MSDLAYLLLTIVFFALALAYVGGCEAVGRERADPGKERTS